MGIKSSNVIFNDIRMRPTQTNTFATWGDFYVNNPDDLTVVDDTSLDLLPDTDTTVVMESGVYKNQLLTGDFDASFNVLDWGGNDSGALGVTIIDASTKTTLDPIYYVEIASYAAYNGGKPFFRRRDPYSYVVTPTIGSNSTVYYKCTRSGNTITFGAGIDSQANDYTKNLTFSGDCYVGVSYYATSSVTYRNVLKEVRDFMII